MIEISVDSTELENFVAAMERFPEKLNEGLVEAVKEGEDLGFLTLTEHPDPIPFPPSQVNWESEKQRRAFHMTNGFGGGDPYERQGKLINALEESTPEVTPGLVSGKVYAVEEWVKFVIGSAYQSTIHAGRWATDRQVAGQIRPQFLEIVQKWVNRVLAESLRGG